MSQRKQTDPLLDELLYPDRACYATGAMLGAEDFQAEQVYHRGRLARVLRFLYGSGTVAGLGVTAPAGAAEPEVDVEPGMAIDAAGRIIEVVTPHSLLLKRWLESQTAEDLMAVSPDRVVVHAAVYLHFCEEEHGLTPSFQAGPYEALNAVSPSRLRDGHRLELRLEVPPVAPVPKDLLPPLGNAKRLRELQNLSLSAWNADAEHSPDQVKTGVLLARLKLPARFDRDAPEWRDGPVDVDPYVRRFVYAAGLLGCWVGIE